MVRFKATVLVAALILLVAPASSLMLEIDIDALTENSVVKPGYLNETGKFQLYNVTVENHGSVGCSYRLKARFNQGDETYTRYSRAYDMWPGATQLMALKYVPLNYTGKIKANVSLTYCGLEDRISSFSFNSTERNTVEGEVESETLDVNSSRAVARIVSVDEGTLVPQDTPPYWRTSSSSIDEGEAVISYDAPIFTDSRNLTYTVLDSEGEILGETSISLKDRTTLREKIRQKLPEILAAALILSIIVNLYQARRRILPDKLFEYLDEVEFDRDIKR